LSLLTLIQNKLGKKLRHTTMPIIIRERGLTIFKTNAPRARKYMGYNPKTMTRRSGIRTQISYATESPSHLDDHEEFLHLLTSIN